MRVGVEVGGTFTDLVAIDGDAVFIAKVPSTPRAPDEGALAAIAAAEIPLDRVDDLVHGSTVATNAILERKGAPTAFITTKGFRDVLALQRHNRRQIYDLAYAKPEPVVRRRDAFEIDERIGADGGVIRPLDEARATEEIERILADGRYQAVAICFLNAYANPAHEAALSKLIREHFPKLNVTCSSDVTREFREYERASTTTLAAFVQPVIDSYLTRFSESLGNGGFRGRFSVMQSNGGRLPAEAMGRNAITSLFSGPAAGVMGAVRQAGLAGHGDLITLDMGGTSTDVCLVAGGKPELASETEVDGLPIRTPVLDIVTVGAGGGSIVWVDDGGLLRVGPRSAGADPGPACYGRGGGEATVTDAHVVRGSLRPDAFLGGKMTIAPEASGAALAPLAERFEMRLAALADSAIRVADANIVRAIQLVSTERGRDPRDYVLVPFGGAGPLHAAAVADELGIATILVPPNAGVLSAYGLLASDFLTYDTLTRRVAVEDDAAETVRACFAEMRRDAEGRFAALGIEGPLRHDYALEMRYVGQAFEVPVSLDEDSLAALDVAGLLARFNEAHHRVFEFGDSGQNAVEIVSFRRGTAAAPASLPALSESGEGGEVAETTIQQGGSEVRAKLLRRAMLEAEAPIAGPALIEDATSTILVPAAWQARRDAADNLVLERC
ncbi:MAG: hydantoinase/oxoprolinase family protein [Alphaproteobacteria bacterium]|jgi:N-methylhydantoinase A|nr:hydantoinase/oxoprolinase family protein [Alphaproteobacteria bacterium]